MKICTRCGVEYPLNGFYVDPTHRDGHASRCKECVKLFHREQYAIDSSRQRASNKRYWEANKERFRGYSRKVREDVLREYGGKCACCGEDTPEFLGVDHVNNDGEAHRREMAGYGRAIYRWLKMNGYPKDGRFQLLCHNCNMAKGLYGGCPHHEALAFIHAA